MPGPRDSEHWKVLIEFYSFFFPVFTDEAQYYLDELRNISSFVIPKIETDGFKDEDFRCVVWFPTFLFN